MQQRHVTHEAGSETHYCVVVEPSGSSQVREI